jgi:hypothetical protein
MILPFRPAIGIMGYSFEASKKDPVVVVQEVLIHVVLNGLFVCVIILKVECVCVESVISNHV